MKTPYEKQVTTKLIEEGKFAENIIHFCKNEKNLKMLFEYLKDNDKMIKINEESNNINFNFFYCLDNLITYDREIINFIYSHNFINCAYEYFNIKQENDRKIIIDLKIIYDLIDNYINGPENQNIEPDLTRMLFADFIMANTDRHYRNFGLIRKTDTLEWIGLAPVFDTERSMFLTKMMPKQDYEAINIEAKPFKDNQAEQFNLLKKEYLTNLPLEKASDTVPLFSSILKLNELIPSERRIALCKTLEARISEAVSLVKEDRKIKITKSRQQRELDRLNTLNSLVVLC